MLWLEKGLMNPYLQTLLKKENFYSILWVAQSTSVLPSVVTTGSQSSPTEHIYFLNVLVIWLLQKKQQKIEHWFATWLIVFCVKEVLFIKFVT